MLDRTVSVIVPIYNTEKYLAGCIESIQSQDYSELEIILVDDGSPDKCGAICDEYAERDPRIRVIHKTNGGASDARNVGIDASTGAYITCVDSDDLIDHRYVSRMMELMTEEIDMVVCAQFLFFDEAELKNVNSSCAGTPDIFEPVDALRELLGQHGYDFEPSPCDKLYRRSLFGCDLRFPVGKYCEDLALTYRLVDRSRKTVRTREKLYFYRQRPASRSHQQLNEEMLSILEVADEMREYILRTHPELRKNVDSRVISAYCHLLIRLPDDPKWNALRHRIYQKVKELRPGQLFSNCRAKNKAAVLCSYGGEKMFLTLMARLSVYNK